MRSRLAFRALLSDGDIIHQPAVFNALTARLAEDAGFEAIALGGYALGADLSVPEPLLSLEDVAQRVRSIALTCDLPLMVDAGAGWGEPMHVRHTVETLEHAGATSFHIEDQIFPKRAHYHKGIEHLVTIEEMTAKISVALSARNDPDFLVVARTDAMLTHGYDEGICRAAAYAEAGADMLMLFPNSEAEARQAPKDLGRAVPLIYCNSVGEGWGRPVIPAARLQDWGWKVVYDAHTSLFVFTAALRDAFARLRLLGQPGLEDAEMHSVLEFVERLVRLDELYAIESQTVEPLVNLPQTDETSL